MCSMCQFCGADSVETEHLNDKGEKDGSGFNGAPSNGCCNLCKEKQEELSTKQDPLNLDITPLISPPVLLSSSESSASSCSDISVDLSSYLRRNQEEVATDSSHEDFSFRVNGDLQISSTAESASVIGRSSISMENKKEKFEADPVYSERDGKIIGTDGSQDQTTDPHKSDGKSFGKENHGSDASHFMDDIWEPPEPEDLDDDVEGSVANYDDDDDECGDGTEWGKPVSLSRTGEGNGSYSFKEEKRRAMDEAMNGKFKALVGQLLRSVGVNPTEKDSESWVDVITSLSWEAASFVKPVAAENKAMDPDGYVKVKCIASGSRSQSQVIRGLVFKKNAAHKHMPIKYKHPRLLLIQGMLGQSSSGLSSFDLMDQETNSLKSITEMIEMYHPNVVLVEKSVSRDVQEFILQKGMTLVFDMKLHRLERVARCTGSQIVSPGTSVGQKLKQCDDFHFEKFIEEHAASGEGGKKPSKTLMFLEGCPTRLGCTILLKGSHSDELKKIKCVVQCAVVMAYHLIMETSFLADQKAMFCTIPFIGMQSLFPSYHESSFVGPVSSSVSHLEESGGKHASSSILDIPISGPDASSLETGSDSVFFCDPYNPDTFSGLSSLQASLKKVIGNNFPCSSTPYQSLSSYFGLYEREQDGETLSAAPVLSSPKAFDHPDVGGFCAFDEEKPIDSEQVPLVSCEAPLDKIKDGAFNEDTSQGKDGISSMLDSQSILVLMSSRNASRGTICEQIRFSHIMFYKNLDVPLGKFFQDNLLNQRHRCMTCGEPPEAHFYYYSHRKKQLTIQVKRLLPEKRLPGEAEQKLWMWSRCGVCKPEGGSTRSTKRIVISSVTRGLSFGQFLAMSFSPGSSLKSSSCGHLLNENFLYFFGLGSMVAVFKYSPVVTYSVYVPPQKLEFSCSNTSGWLDKEIEHVYKKGTFLFVEVENALQSIGSRFGGSNPMCEGSQCFSDIEEMLKRERSDFEAKIKNVKNADSDKFVYKLLSLNRLLWELLLESCVWDRRLYLLSSSATVNSGTGVKAARGEHKFKEEDGGGEVIDRAFDNCKTSDDTLYKSTEENVSLIQEIPIEGPVQGSVGQDDLRSSILPGIVDQCSSGHNVLENQYSGTDNCTGETLPAYLEADRVIPILKDPGKSGSCFDHSLSEKGSSLSLLLSSVENSKEYVWTPFQEIQWDCTKDIRRGYMPKFEPLTNHKVEFLSLLHQLINEEGSRLHICIDNYMVLDFEDELSSIIACAVALLRDSLALRADIDRDIGREKGSTLKTTESSNGIPRIASMTSPYSSTIFLESDGTRATTLSLEESRFSSFDLLNSLNSLASFGALHPEVPIGVGKLPGKCKYLVVTYYANQFRDLRSCCSLPELNYIASLSRCRTWDAKGGKSKSFFAKTLDDRFIIKEIKKTEIDSFMKFASEYFKYIKHSFESGSQTCLAKILGIYQVRLMKSGKEVKHDLMVMENLTFGRNINRQYDLKGALHARFNAAAGGSEDVLLDQNFVNDMNASPLYVSNKAKRMLQRAVWNDTTFLNSINVMDYSLLVGVDSQRQELVCGIIDYLRQYTWDKQLETWVKSSLVVPRNLMPTVISPIEYKKRFRKFMSTHFFSVPDSWCLEKSSDPCELRRSGNDDSSNVQIPKGS